MQRLVLAILVTVYDLELVACNEDVDVITVSGGSFTPPYYLFDGSPDVPTLEEGKTYRFEDGGVDPSHPFHLSGSLDASNPGASDFELPVEFTFSGEPVGYYCAAHSSMSGSFMIEGSSIADDTNNDGGGDDNEDHDHGSGYDEHDHGTVGVELVRYHGFLNYGSNAGGCFSCAADAGHSLDELCRQACLADDLCMAYETAQSGIQPFSGQSGIQPYLGQTGNCCLEYEHPTTKVQLTSWPMCSGQSCTYASVFMRPLSAYDNPGSNCAKQASCWSTTTFLESGSDEGQTVLGAKGALAPNDGRPECGPECGPECPACGKDSGAVRRSFAIPAQCTRIQDFTEPPSWNYIADGCPNDNAEADTVLDGASCMVDAGAAHPKFDPPPSPPPSPPPETSCPDYEGYALPRDGRGCPPVEGRCAIEQGCCIGKSEDWCSVNFKDGYVCEDRGTNRGCELADCCVPNYAGTIIGIVGGALAGIVVIAVIVVIVGIRRRQKRQQQRAVTQSQTRELTQATLQTRPTKAAQPTAVAAAPPPMTTMDVTCPPGCKEGDQVRIQSPSGQVIQVAVPPGVSPGQVFRAQVPAPTTVATASVAMKGELVA